MEIPLKTTPIRGTVEKHLMEVIMPICHICRKSVSDNGSHPITDDEFVVHDVCYRVLELAHVNALNDFTCLECPILSCEFRFDPYNTRGDCLALK